MLTPTLEPTFLCIKTGPGATGTASVMIDRAPSATIVRARMVGDPQVRVKEVIVSERFLRQLSEEEIRELPRFPPSIRDRARRGQMQSEELNVVGRGTSGAKVDVGNLVQIDLEYALGAVAPEGIMSSTLEIEAEGWTTTRVPVFVLAGTPTTTLVVSHSRIDRALLPGETVPQTVTVHNVPSATRVLAFLVGGADGIRLTSLVAMEPVRRHDLTEEELRELPAHPPSIRENARRLGYIEWQARATSDGRTPLAVAAGQTVNVGLDFSGPPNTLVEFASSRLVIDAPFWHRIEIPIQLTFGRIAFEVSPAALDVRQGDVAQVKVVASSLAGPATDVHLDVGRGDDAWRFEPSIIHVPRRDAAAETVELKVAPDAPLGVFDLGFEARYFEDLAVHQSPFQIRVRPSPVTVRAAPAALTVRQGAATAVRLEFVIPGGYKRITMRPGTLPIGVHMALVDQFIGPAAGTHAVQAAVTVAPDAPTGPAQWMPVVWSANDGEHQGLLNVPITIELQPEAQKFRGQILTPSGTALGGSAEITIQNDGTVRFSGSMRGSGFDPYEFTVTAVVRAPDGKFAIAAAHSGSVGGAILGGSRTHAWDEPEPNENLRLNWSRMRNTRADFSKAYSNTGVLGALGDIGATLVDLVATRILVGPYVAAIVVLGRKFLGAANLPLVRPNDLAGVGCSGPASSSRSTSPAPWSRWWRTSGAARCLPRSGSTPTACSAARSTSTGSA